jgi:NADH:ubiquinone oxidoreductase subunit
MHRFFLALLMMCWCYKSKCRSAGMEWNESPTQPAEFNEWLHFRVKCARRGEKCADFEREKGHNGKIIACMPRGRGSIKLRGPIFIALNRNKVHKYHKVSHSL